MTPQEAELAAGRDWEAFGRPLGWRLVGWTGDASATFRAADHYTFQVTAPIRRYVTEALAAQREADAKIAESAMTDRPDEVGSAIWHTCAYIAHMIRTGAPEWRPIETAPKDGTPFQARIPGHGSDNVIAWTDGLIDSQNNDCGGWAFVEDQERPDCWTDGICWEVNESGSQSVKPTHWKPLNG